MGEGCQSLRGYLLTPWFFQRFEFRSLLPPSRHLLPELARAHPPNAIEQPPLHMTKTLAFRVSKSKVNRIGPTAPSRRSVRDRCVVDRYVARPAERPVAPVRYHLVPENGWNDHTRQLRCGMNNVIEWDGNLPLPAAPSSPCWLLPAKDDMALCISRLQHEIIAAGWKVRLSPARSAGAETRVAPPSRLRAQVLTCDEAVISRLSNKAKVRVIA